MQRRQLSVTMTNEVFLAQFDQWMAQMREIAVRRPGTGACTLASAMQLWLWTLNHLQHATDAHGVKLYQSARQGVSFALADALCWLLASRYQILDVLELEEQGPDNPALAEGLAGLVQFCTDLCHVQAARAAGEVGRICAELVFGYGGHPAWDGEGRDSCYQAQRTGGAGERHARVGQRGGRGRRSGRLASVQSRPVRRSRGDGAVRAPALEARWLPDRSRCWPRTAPPKR